LPIERALDTLGRSENDTSGFSRLSKIDHL
jgi:hypothetical protein